MSDPWGPGGKFIECGLERESVCHEACADEGMCILSPDWLPRGVIAEDPDA
ncbi:MULTISPECIES: hypothetical protein [unclassified Nocardioides]|uniref:hypothetical protein n=1 Tax=unclassified Nocardioides TaxID=2615069 RepID=UPI003615EDAA